MLCRAFVLMACALFICANPGAAQVGEPIPQGQTLIPDAARPTVNFDVERATRAYLDSIPAEQRAKSDAYFEGGYWLQLVGLLYGLGVAAILLFGRISARMRDRVERITRQPWLQTMLYAAAWIALTALMTLPLSLYQGWFREHQYGLSNLSLPAWLGEQAKSLLISMILGSIVLAIIYAFVRRRGGNWWLPASVVSVLFILFVQFHLPGIPRAGVQQLQAARCWAGTRHDACARARQRCTGDRGLLVRCFQADHPHQRERQRAALTPCASA